MLNLDQIRRDTPGCAIKVHFNNAGASLSPSPVTEAIQEYISFESKTGGYEYADARSTDIQAFYSSAASLINAQSKNIAFTSSATNSFALALSSFPFKSGDVVLIANEDYISNQIALLSMQNRIGIKLLRAKSLPTGGLDLDDMEQLINTHNPKLVSVTHIPTHTGLIQPVEEVGSLCEKKGVPYLVDACQSVGQIPVNVKQIKCDFLSATMRKFLRGPRGAGFLYASDSILGKKLAPLFVDMKGAEWTGSDTYQVRADAKRFEEWELPYALVMGSKAAIDYALQIGIEEITTSNKTLCNTLRSKLTSIGLRVLDIGNKLSSIVTVEILGKSSTEVLEYLRGLNINTSTSHRAHAHLDFGSKKIDWALRISPHYFNSEDEIDTLIQSLEYLND